MTEERKPSDVLLGAETALLEHGWTQRKLVDPSTGSVCLAGSLSVSVADHAILTNPMHTPLSRQEQELLLAARAYVRRAVLKKCSDMADDWDLVPRFNDFVGRTFNEVLDITHEAALLAKEEGR